MQVSFKINATNAQLEKMFLQEIRNAMDNAIKKAIPAIKTKVGEFIRKAIASTPEYNSLLNGKLRTELGLKNPDAALNAILDALANGVTINYTGLTVSTGGVSGGFVIGLVKDKFSELLGLPEAKYMSGHNEIPWLDWLLFKGDSIIITDYSIRYDTNVNKSRTDNAIMVKNKEGWRMPPEFSGMEDNNFITRAFTDGLAEEEIGKIVEAEIIKGL